MSVLTVVLIPTPREHLRRRHIRPPQCDRCWAVIEDPKALQQHRRADPICEPKDLSNELDGASQEQMNKIEAPASFARAHSDREQWLVIYKILFPEERVQPSHRKRTHKYLQPVS